MSWGVAASHGGAVIIGFALGIGYMGWHTGAWTTTGAAAEVRQGAVDDAVRITEQLTEAETTASTAAERVRTIIREVQVPGDCDDVRYLSDSDAAELQAIFSKTGPFARKREVGSTAEP